MAHPEGPIGATLVAIGLLLIGPNNLNQILEDICDAFQRLMEPSPRPMTGVILVGAVCTLAVMAWVAARVH